MGLLSFPSGSEGIIPVLIFHTIFSMALIKNLVVSLAQVVGVYNWASLVETEQDWNSPQEQPERNWRKKKVTITQFKYLSRYSESSIEEEQGECCVCLCGYDVEDEVSEVVSCKHFFHTGCLDKWFDNNHATCPICRSIV